MDKSFNEEASDTLTSCSSLSNSIVKRNITDMITNLELSLVHCGDEDNFDSIKEIMTKKLQTIKEFITMLTTNKTQYNNTGFLTLYLSPFDKDKYYKEPSIEGIGAGLDLYISEDKHIPRNKVVKIPTNVSLNGSLLLIDMNLYGTITGRSSTGVNKQIIVLQGTIDPDFSGEIFISAYSLEEDGIEVKQGDRIAQLIIKQFIPIKCKKPEDNIIVLKEIADITRGDKGCGSSGV